MRARIVELGGALFLELGDGVLIPQGAPLILFPRGRLLAARGWRTADDYVYAWGADPARTPQERALAARFCTPADTG